MNTSTSIEHDLQLTGDKKRATLVARYFKTGKGEYGEGDVFIGLTVPQQRKIAKRHVQAQLFDIETLLHSSIHEYRQTALYIMTYKWKKADPGIRKKLYDTYLRNTAYINNWDLVDCSAPTIVGGYLLDKKGERKIFYKLVRSKNIWERRIAVLATFMFISHNEFRDSLRIAELLVRDKHDLIHKAVGWMLREIGKRDEKSLTGFLTKYYKTMPRTMLRYAIEKFPNNRRLAYLAGKM